MTGGCGFIGSRLIRTLRRRGGHSIRVLDDLSVGTREALEEASGGEAELVVGSILDQDAARQACRGVDAVIHLAASAGVRQSVEDPIRDHRINSLGTLRMLEAARRAGATRFVFASSGAALGACEPPIHERLAARPLTPYGAGKLAAEGYCCAYHGTFGLDTVCLRFGNVYGPGSGHKTSAVAKFIRLALAGEPIEVFGDGTQTRDFVYVEDLVDAVLRAATTDRIGGEVFQIATSRETSVLELVETLRSVLAERGVAEPRTRHGELPQGDTPRNFADTSKARERLGWRAQTDLAEGLGRTVDWFLSLRGATA